jgi:hypothetical protein
VFCLVLWRLGRSRSGLCCRCYIGPGGLRILLFTLFILGILFIRGIAPCGLAAGKVVIIYHTILL